MDNYETLTTRLKDLPDVFRRILLDEDFQFALQAATDALPISEDQKLYVRNETIKLFLFLVPLEEFLTNTTEQLIAPETRATMISFLKEEVGDDVWKVIEDAKITTENDSSVVTFLTEETPEVAESPAPTPDIPPASITPPAMRTMEQDIGKIHGYGMVEDDVENVITPPSTEKIIKSTSQADLQKRTTPPVPATEEKEMKME